MIGIRAVNHIHHPHAESGPALPSTSRVDLRFVLNHLTEDQSSMASAEPKTPEVLLERSRSAEWFRVKFVRACVEIPQSVARTRCGQSRVESLYLALIHGPLLNIRARRWVKATQLIKQHERDNSSCIRTGYAPEFSQTIFNCRGRWRTAERSAD